MALAFVVTLARTSFQPELFRYSFDSGQELSHALDIIEGRHYPTVGMSIGGQSVSVGPFVYYLMVPAVAVGRSAGAVAVWFGVLAGLASALLVWLGWRYLSPATGVLAGLVHALSATTLEWSVFVINAGALPLFSVLTLIAVTKAIERPAAWALLAGVAIGLATQCHPATVAFLPMLPLGAWLARRRWPWHGWLTYGAGVAVTYFSWIRFEMGSGYAQLRSLLRIAGNRRYEGVRYVSSHSFADLLADVSSPVAIHRWGVLAGLVALGVCAALVWRRRRADAEVGRAWDLLAACLAAVLAWVPFTWGIAAHSASFDGPEYTRFFLPVLPVACLVAACGFTAPALLWRAAAWRPCARPWLERWAPRLVTALGAAGVIGGATFALGWAGEGARPFWVTPGFPPPDLSIERQILAYVKRLEARILKDLDGRFPDELAFVGTQNLVFPEEDQMTLLAIEPLLRLEAMKRTVKRHGAPPSPPPFLTVVTGTGCGRPPATIAPPTDPVERARVLTFDDCGSFDAWLSAERRACNARGQPTWVLQGNLRGSSGPRPCARPSPNGGYALDTLDPSGLVELARKDGDALDRADLVRMVAERGTAASGALAGLAALAADAAPEVRGAALWAMARVAPAEPRVASALIAALDDGERTVREAALYAIGAASVVSARDAAAAHAQDPDPATRDAARWAVAQLTPPS
ncbi:MAG: HEAT repeat domain-containing protein [Deltaproteobacteria bacterium]|nr:HEAT repeat domain-containing protein [Deltaproteobacteria bacterium]